MPLSFKEPDQGRQDFIAPKYGKVAELHHAPLQSGLAGYSQVRRQLIGKIVELVMPVLL
ncbi:hypothetical protein I2I11_12605 [Pontibacter sp. 172403-2]|uniref:hypothetical protein n=1 Tax=Pontibacter rufus TaxID=2791028 RepID=UPI0018AF5996|nr:hypothetical protein [Pontibacter sp. 172403-2]MBF9254137.1 hypothetical protein [Pontibacter sp. 172403-2]